MTKPADIEVLLEEYEVARQFGILRRQLLDEYSVSSDPRGVGPNQEERPT